MLDKLIVGLIGIISGFLLVLLNSWLDTRRKLDEDTRKERWQVYKLLWELTKLVPKWPRNEQLTLDLHSRIRGALHFYGA